jgi:pimeloyl-ACP methyl ester carboxylesterase
MYLPDPTRVAPAEAGLVGVKEIEIAVSDGVTLIAWYAPAKDDKPTLLYFHGNAANAGNRAPRIETILANGFGIFYLNNRGYGGSGGRPTEKDKFKRSKSGASAFSISTTEATADQPDGLRRKTSLPTQLRATII